MDKKTYSRTWKSMSGVALLALVLLLAPAASAQELGQRSFTIAITNESPYEVSILGAELTQGQWASGMRPRNGNIYHGSTTVGPFRTLSTDMGQGNGATLYLAIGGTKCRIRWLMPWSGQAQVSYNLSDNSLEAQAMGPMSDPNKQHLTYQLYIR